MVDNEDFTVHRINYVCIFSLMLTFHYIKSNVNT